MGRTKGAKNKRTLEAELRKRKRDEKEAAGEEMAEDEALQEEKDKEETRALLQADKKNEARRKRNLIKKAESALDENEPSALLAFIEVGMALTKSQALSFEKCLELSVKSHYRRTDDVRLEREVKGVLALEVCVRGTDGRLCSGPNANSMYIEAGSERVSIESWVGNGIISVFGAPRISVCAGICGAQAVMEPISLAAFLKFLYPEWSTETQSVESVAQCFIDGLRFETGAVGPTSSRRGAPPISPAQIIGECPVASLFPEGAPLPTRFELSDSDPWSSSEYLEEATVTDYSWLTQFTFRIPEKIRNEVYAAYGEMVCALLDISVFCKELLNAAQGARSDELLEYMDAGTLDFVRRVQESLADVVLISAGLMLGGKPSGFNVFVRWARNAIVQFRELRRKCGGETLFYLSVSFKFSSAAEYFMSIRRDGSTSPAIESSSSFLPLTNGVESGPGKMIFNLFAGGRRNYAVKMSNGSLSPDLSGLQDQKSPIPWRTLVCSVCGTRPRAEGEIVSPDRGASVGRFMVTVPCTVMPGKCKRKDGISSEFLLREERLRVLIELLSKMRADDSALSMLRSAFGVSGESRIIEEHMTEIGDAIGAERAALDKHKTDQIIALSDGNFKAVRFGLRDKSANDVLSATVLARAVNLFLKGYVGAVPHAVSAATPLPMGGSVHSDYVRLVLGAQHRNI